MISPAYVETMAHYNRWQNQSLFEAANGLSDSQRREDRGAFFGSLHTTLAHIMWADRIWMNRFADTPPTSPEDRQGKGPAYLDWPTLTEERAAFDEIILNWALGLSEAWLAAEFTWTNSAGTLTRTQPAWVLVTHLFNHAAHHRGQAHALLTSFGVTPEDTDLPLMLVKD